MKNVTLLENKCVCQQIFKIAKGAQHLSDVNIGIFGFLILTWDHGHLFKHQCIGTRV